MVLIKLEKRTKGGRIVSKRGETLSFGKLPRSDDQDVDGTEAVKTLRAKVNAPALFICYLKQNVEFIWI